jgi:orotidine-5'-phosphate decarboxylase
MYVVGATKAEALAEIRQIIPEHFLLVPGYGSQGGELAAVARYGLNSQCGLLVNSSRGIIYADNSKDFAKTARKIAQEIAQEMEKLGLYQ